MVSNTSPTPWGDYRSLAETAGQAIADALSNAIGSNVELGIAAACDPDEMLTGRPLPVRAIVVRYGRPLRDVIVFLSSLREDLIRPLIDVAAAAALQALEVSPGSDAHGAMGQFTVEDAIEYETIEEALEQCDALYLEASYTLELPTGELRMVLGTGLLESATSFRAGEADPFAEEPACERVAADGELVLADAISIQDADALELGDPLGTTTLTADASALDALDAQLAAQQHAATAAATATARANIESAALAAAAADVASSRWTELLSGVEVELSAELGRTELALGDITGLTADSVLTLDQLVHEPVTVYVNGTPYATARLVVVDGEYGIEIVEVMDHAVLATTLAAA